MRYSFWNILGQGLTGNRGWGPAWRDPAPKDSYDVIIIGAGPTGLTAATYLGREGADVLVLDKAGVGGQAGITQVLDNFPGFDEGISGAEFADRLARQATRFGAEIVNAQAVTSLSLIHI